MATELIVEAYCIIMITGYTFFYCQRKIAYFPLFLASLYLLRSRLYRAKQD